MFNKRIFELLKDLVRNGGAGSIVDKGKPSHYSLKTPDLCHDLREQILFGGR